MFYSTPNFANSTTIKLNNIIKNPFIESSFLISGFIVIRYYLCRIWLLPKVLDTFDWFCSKYS